MAKNIFMSGKQARPKTAVKGKRYLCAKCRKRSPKPVKSPAPWYCPNCLKVVLVARARTTVVRNLPIAVRCWTIISVSVRWYTDNDWQIVC